MAPGEHQVAVKPALARRNLGKRHADLECDARLLRQNPDRATLADRPAHRVEERADRGVLASKVVPEVVAAARVRLVPVREPPPAARADPERPYLANTHGDADCATTAPGTPTYCCR